MSSAHDRILVELATRDMSENPNLAAVVAQYCKLLNLGHFANRYVESLCQKPWGNFDFYEAWAFSQLHWGFCTGEFLAARICVGADPTKDLNAYENNRRLSGLPSQFTAVFRGGFSDHDGRLAWTAEVELGEMRPHQPQIQIRVAPGDIPLEVGYTKMSRTLLHMTQDGGLARWPYGHDCMWLYLRRTHRLFNAAANRKDSVSADWTEQGTSAQKSG